MSELAATVNGPIGAPAAGRTWQRHCVLERLLRFAVWLVIVVAVVQSLRSIEVIPDFFYDAPQQMGDMLGRIWPVDSAYYGSDVQAALIETLHIATLGTLLSIVLAIPFAILMSSNLTQDKALNLLARVILVASRLVRHWYGRCCLLRSSGRARWPARWPLRFARSALSARWPVKLSSRCRAARSQRCRQRV